MAYKNHMIPTPIQRCSSIEQEVQERLYRGVGLAQLNILRDQMRLGGLTIGSRQVRLHDGVVVECNICFNNEYIIVHTVPQVAERTTHPSVVPVNIIFHPRNGIIEKVLTLLTEIIVDGASTVSTVFMFGVQGGWENGNVLLEDKYAFPLIDEDNASFIANSTDDGHFAGEDGKYGNIFWIGASGSALSWHGPPSRHFALPSRDSIPGLSKLEYFLDGINPVVNYTAFDNKLYRQGKVVAVSPNYTWVGADAATAFESCIVLGAGINKTDGMIYGVFFSNRRGAPTYVVVMSDNHTIYTDDLSVAHEYSSQTGASIRQQYMPAKSGLYICLFVYDGNGVDGWTLISEHAASRNGLVWFANEDCTEFICSNGDVLNLNGNLSHPTQTNVRINVSVPRENGINVGARSSFNMSYSANLLYEFMQNNKINASIVASFTAQSNQVSHDTTYASFSGNTVVYAPGEEPSPITVIYGPDYIDHEGTYGFSVLGQGDGDITWSGGGISAGGILTVDSIHRCGAITITATDSCGSQASKSVRLPDGIWILESEEVFDEGYSSYCVYIPGCRTVTTVIGDTRYVERFIGLCGAGAASATTTVKACVYPRKCEEQTFATSIENPSWCSLGGSPHCDYSAPQCEDGVFKYIPCSTLGATCSDEVSKISVTQILASAVCVAYRKVEKYVCA